MKFLSKQPAIIASILLISFLFLLAPKISSAAVPTFETNPKVVGSEVITSIKSIVTALSTAGGLSQQLLEWAFKLAAEQLKRQLLNMIVDQIVNWIQGGGNPKFISDWPGFFRDAIDQAGGRFLKQLGLGQLCSPLMAAKLSASFIPIPKFSERSSCTLSKVGANLDAFLKNFKNGGWVAWNEMILSPQDNIYGAYILAWDQYEIEKSAAAKAADAEARAGNGFLSVRRCAETRSQPDGAGGFESYCAREEIVTPGAVVGGLASKAVGSDIDYIVNADDFAAYVSAITNAILNRMFSEGLGLLKTTLTSSSSGGGGGGGTLTAAQIQCSQLTGSPAYSQCVNSVQSGVDVREFQKNHLISYINEDLSAQSQLIGAKQATITVLNSSIGILTDLAACQGSATQLNQVTDEKNKIAQHITAIQSDIIALQMKQQEIKAVTDLSMVTTLYTQVITTINPAKTQTLVFSAQDETNQKYKDEAFYQQKLDACLRQRLLQQQQQQQGGGQ